MPDAPVPASCADGAPPRPAVPIRATRSGTLQTRKWTDQGGQEHTTTEVVVPRFRGELTLLGGGARESGGTEIGSPEDFGDTGYRSPAPGPGSSERGPSDPSRGGHGQPTSIADQLDDDIPF